MIRLFCALILWAGIAAAETNIELTARQAVTQLNRAITSLEQAQSANNRVAALSETVRAFETGLTAMRNGLRQAVIRETQLAQSLNARDTEIARLLTALQTLSRTPAPVLFIHPSGPVGSARAGMMISELTPALNSRAQELRAQVQELSILRALQESAADKLSEGLQRAQDARSELSRAIADRIDLPQRFIENPEQTAVLIASAETLDGFASGLSSIAINEPETSLPDVSFRKGQLRWPVTGRLLRRAGESDSAGVSRPGVVLATLPAALVTTPMAATVRYQGPLLDYGQVVILEPQNGVLMVLSGLAETYAKTGQVLPSGSPVGLMAAHETPSGANLITGQAETATEFSETLYIEIREDNTPVNPETWFLTDKEE